MTRVKHDMLIDAGISCDDCQIGIAADAEDQTVAMSCLS